MKILISNDDGIHAPGIQELARQLAVDCGHTVYVVAPDRERSTTSHSLTLHKPLRAIEVPDFAPGVQQAWKVNGSPCDCVKLAVGAILDPCSIDLVVSGINRGPNMGTDVIYSGTVSAAIEGAVAGYPAIAVSLASFADRHYHTASAFVGKLVQKLDTFSIPDRTVLNVNVPPLEIDDIAGVKITKLGLHRFRDIFEKRVDLRKQLYYWQAGIVEDKEEDPDADVLAIQANQVSITPIHYDMTEYTLIDELKRWDIRH